MEVIIFDIVGKFAHFRKYYTNSSSLSYSIPPRTSIMGFIGAILGYERDSYYELFSRKNINIAVKKLTKNKRIMQTLNYMKITSPGEITNPKLHTQIPFELITDDKNIVYRIYVSHKDANIMEELERRLREKKYYYAPYMGAAPFNCNINFIEMVQGEESIKDEEVDVATVINCNYICEKGLNFSCKDLCLLREKMPAEFSKGRNIKTVDPYIFDDKGKQIKVKLNKEFVNVKYNYGSDTIEENIVFM